MPCAPSPPALQAELARKELEIAAECGRDPAKTLQIEKLKVQLAVLRRAQFGRSSEKLDRDIEQLELLIGDLEEEAAEARRGGRPMPPSRQIRIARARPRRDRAAAGRASRCPTICRARTSCTSRACPCPGCGGTVSPRSARTTRGARIRPRPLQGDAARPAEAELPRLRDDHPGADALACRSSAAGRARACWPMSPSPSIADHLPLYRQSAIYAREGVDLDRSTDGRLGRPGGWLLDPLAEAIGRHVRAGEMLHADDTPVPVLAPGRGRTRTGRLWVDGARRAAVARHGAAGGLLSLHARPQGRARRGAARQLAAASCMPTAMPASSTLYDPRVRRAQAPRLIEVACWAMRGAILRGATSSTGSPIGQEALERIARPVRHRAQIQRPRTAGAPGRPRRATPSRCSTRSRRSSTGADQISGKSKLGRGDPLRALALGSADAATPPTAGSR